MRDHRYSVQRARTIRRPIVTLQTYNYATWFLHQINHVFATYPPTRIYNADETNIGQLEDYVQVVGRINKPGQRVAMKYDKKTLLTACLTCLVRNVLGERLVDISVHDVLLGTRYFRRQ